MATVIAKIARDHIQTEQLGREFHFEALPSWWGWPGFLIPTKEKILDSPKVDFKLYDDDSELYYSGWLHNDANGILQQFVLGWGASYAGCTLIKVKIDDRWTQEIS